MPFAGSSAPSGWLLCFGQAISRTTYASLFTTIGTTYGVGDGSTTFNLPDLRGRVVAGEDDMGGTSANRLTNLSGGLDGDVLGATGGSESHTLTTAQVPNHGHTTSSFSTAGSHSHNTIGDHNHVVQGRASTSTTAHSHAGGRFAKAPSTGTTNSDENTVTGGGHSHSADGGHTHTLTVDSTAGGGGAQNNVQPTIILNYIIKT